MGTIITLTRAKMIAGLLLVSVLGAGTVYAASTVVHNGLLDQQEAENFAFMDADVKADDVTNLRTHLEKDDGVYVYDIDFYVGNTEYEYEVRAEDGVILEKDKEDKSGKVKTDAAAVRDSQAASQNAPQKDSGSTSGKAETGKEEIAAEAAADNKYISVDRAKQIALQDAGLREEEVNFITAKFEDDDGRKEYEVEFYKGNLEYEYDIDAVTGEILESEVEDDDD